MPACAVFSPVHRLLKSISSDHDPLHYCHSITDIQGTCATKGDGLYEGLDWVQSMLTSREVKKTVVKPVKEVINSVSPESKPSGKPATRSWWTMITSYFAIASS